MKRFALILLLLCVAGCAVPTGTLAGKKDTTEIIKNSEYAYVLVGVSGCAGSNWLHTSLPYTQKPKNDEMMWIPGSSTKCGER